MSVEFSKAGADVQLLCRNVLNACHKHLSQARVDVLCLFASDEDKKGNRKHAVKLRGRFCAATARIVSLPDRASGMADAVITIDELAWDGLSPSQREALLDHELTHLELTHERDACGRPVLKMRKHDWELHGFHEVLERRGVESLEYDALYRFRGSLAGQMVFKFFGYTAETSEPKTETFSEMSGSSSDLSDLEEQLSSSMTERMGAPVEVKIERSYKVSDDELFDQAVAFIREIGRVSTSSVQRKLRIGYNRAAKLMELLEERGVISAPLADGSRELLEMVGA
jgi:hypothetical protein